MRQNRGWDWKTIERQYNSVEDTITSITIERTISELRRPVSSIPLWCSWWDGVELWWNLTRSSLNFLGFQASNLMAAWIVGPACQMFYFAFFYIDILRFFHIGLQIPAFCRLIQMDKTFIRSRTRCTSCGSDTFINQLPAAVSARVVLPGESKSKCPDFWAWKVSVHSTCSFTILPESFAQLQMNCISEIQIQSSKHRLPIDSVLFELFASSSTQAIVCVIKSKKARASWDAGHQTNLTKLKLKLSAPRSVL